MFERAIKDKAIELSGKYPFVVITGPRQSGKTTLARCAFPDYRKVSLEDLDNRDFAQQDPRGFIATYPDRTIIDEVQRVPSLLSYLQTHCDNAGKDGMYILTGSQNLQLMQAVDQSLAGRAGLLHLLPLSRKEMRNSGIVPSSIDLSILQGCYPRLYDRSIAPADYYPNYIKTYVERDVRNLKDIGDLSKFVRFLKLCAARTAQLLNKTTLANDCGISVPTVDSWLSLLESSYIVFLLKPDFRNYSKRLVKTPKLYFHDTGLACSLLEIKDEIQMSTHYLRGNLFENLVVSDFLKDEFNRGVQDPPVTFWRDSSGHEVDLLYRNGQMEYAYEIKSARTFNDSFLDGLKYWSGLSGADASCLHVIYGGDTPMSRSEAHVETF
ncbi:MAG: ATP-binding protein [Bacteroidaceae bacterium]|nr:ATP-binding protein [Bacteroidaceae bacterium]